MIIPFLDTQDKEKKEQIALIQFTT